jgi:hypothetical protein
MRVSLRLFFLGQNLAKKWNQKVESEVSLDVFNTQK